MEIMTGTGEIRKTFASILEWRQKVMAVNKRSKSVFVLLLALRSPVGR